MYSWDDKTDDWATPGSYAYDAKSAPMRKTEGARSASEGPRTYANKGQPNTQLTDPKKLITSTSKNPLVIAVDVTGSMQRWPAEIFDRLPLLYYTLSQYRPDLEISFAAIGDAGCDRWPLQTTEFAKGFDLEKRLAALYGEGGGGDEPESYGLFAWWLERHVTTPEAERPFLIVFGDATMHETVPAAQIKHFAGDDPGQDASSIVSWNEISRRFNTWFLRRATGRPGDAVEQQWAKAVGAQQVVLMTDDQRAVAYAMGLVARSWGHFGDFKQNMAARQDAGKIEELEKRLDEVVPRALVCPKCAAPVPLEARGRGACAYCGATIVV